MEMPVALQQIRPYVEPEYFIEPEGNAITNPEGIEEIINGAHDVEVVERNPQGWENYDVILRTIHIHDHSYYYLARTGTR